MDVINNINLVDGLNINPIPLEFSQSLTTTKWLASMQAKINELILISNSVSDDVVKRVTDYSDAKYTSVLADITNLHALLNNGNIIPDGSIGLEKLNSVFTEQFTNTIIDVVKKAAQFVSFGLNDDGYFVAYIPSSWSVVTFNTDIDGNLTLSY